MLDPDKVRLTMTDHEPYTIRVQGEFRGLRSYVNTSGSTYAGPFPNAPGGELGYVRDFTTVYALSYNAALTYTVLFISANYLGGLTYLRDYNNGLNPVDFTVNYTRNVDVTYTRNFSSTYQREFVGGYTTNYVGNYQREFVGGYTTNYVGDYQNEFSQSYTTSYTTGYLSDYDGAVYTTTYERAFTGVYSTSYEGNFDANYTTTYEGNYEQIYDKDFDTSYITDYLGNFQGNFEGETIQSANATNETYTLYVRIS